MADSKTSHRLSHPPSSVVRRTVLAACLLVGLAGAAPAQPPADALLLRGGERRSGRLQSCVGETCYLDGAAVARSAIEWIGLGVGEAVPPEPKSRDRDEAHLVDGSTRAGKLVGISLGTVALESGPLERAAVRWIHLAREPAREPPASETPVGAPSGAPGEGPPSPSAPGTEPQPAEPPAEQQPVPEPPPVASPSAGSGTAPASPALQPPLPPRPPGDEPKPCSADKPLGGWIRLRYSEETVGCLGWVDVFLRFPLAQDAQGPWPGVLWSGFTGTGLHYDIRSSGCNDMPGDTQVCRGGGFRSTGRMDFQSPAPDGRPMSDGYLKFNPLGPELMLSPESDESGEAGSPHTCDGNVTSPTGWSARVPFLNIGSRYGPCAREPMRFCPRLTICTDPANDALCMGNEGRYAVLPFAGHATFDEPGWTIHHSEIAWEICCGCDAPPPELEPGGPRPDTSCEGAAAELARLVGRMRALKEAYEAHEPDFRRAEEQRAAWRDKIWGAKGSLADFSANLMQIAAATGQYVPGSAPLDARAARSVRYHQALGQLIGGIQALQQTDDLQQVNAAIDVLAAEGTWEVIGNVGYLAAVERVKRFLRTHPGELEEAKRIWKAEMNAYKETLPGVKVMMSGMAVINAFLQFSDSAKRLGADLPNYALWAGDAERAQAEMEEIQDKMRDVQVLIDALRARCPVETGTIQGAARRSTPLGVVPASFHRRQARGAVTLAQGVPSQPRSAEALATAVAEKLEKLATIYARVEGRARETILTALLPFIFDDAKAVLGVDRRLVVATLQEALPDLEGLETDGKEAVALGAEIQKLVEEINPTKESSVRTSPPWAAAAARVDRSGPRRRRGGAAPPSSAAALR